MSAIFELGCDVCQLQGKYRCINCKRTAYCGRECQKKDWSKHKKICVIPASIIGKELKTDNPLSRYQQTYKELWNRVFDMMQLNHDLIYFLRSDSINAYTLNEFKEYIKGRINDGFITNLEYSYMTKKPYQIVAIIKEGDELYTSRFYMQMI